MPRHPYLGAAVFYFLGGYIMNNKKLLIAVIALVAVIAVLLIWLEQNK